MSFPTPASSGMVRAARVQIECEKQCNAGADRWSDRTLTIDRASTTLTISRHLHPSNFLYHSIRPAMVQTWPHFSRETIAEEWYSAEAKRTLCILGTVAAVPDVHEAEKGVALVGIPLPMFAASEESAMVMAEAVYPPAEYVAEPSSQPAAAGKQRKSVVGRASAWVLRFATPEAYEAAVQMLGQLSGVKFARRQTTTASSSSAFSAEKPLIFSSLPIGLLSTTKKPKSTYVRTQVNAARS